eukprot:1147065-Pelagomonas_calceolata.AAC.7
MVPKLAAIKVKEGKQLQLGIRYKPEELLARLKQPTQLKKHKQRFDIIIAEDLPGKSCALRCIRCKDIFSPANPSHAGLSNSTL